MLKPVSSFQSLNKSKKSFDLIPVTKFASLSHAGWIVKSILPRGELAVIYGEPGCGKTFFALDMAMSVARGLDWQHKRTSKGRVIYLCAEAAYGFKKRTLAYLTHHKINLQDSLDFEVISEVPDFLQEFDAPNLADSIGKADVIVVDTFSRVMIGGNENSGEDMGFAIAQCKILHELTGAIIILIHHSGKDSDRGARGWSGLLGACDTEIEIKKFTHGHKAKVTKQKDGEDGEEWGFTLEVVDLGTDDDGDLITSCIYKPSNSIPLEDTKISGKRGLAPSLKTVLDAFESFCSPYVPEEELIKYIISRRSYDKTDGKRDTRRQIVVRALNDLCDLKELKLENDMVSKFKK